ncbi:DUF2785 domain-containing protein [Brevibacillus fluminis]|uniref:DUF2785 domain-containing protein n=1 Tax=Brevibacillus fluminis TaxID=511487 RepID=UPI003F8894BF
MNDIRSTLIRNLHRIEGEHYELRDGETQQQFITLMLQHIGAPDPALRDKLIYPTFHEWITREKLTESELRGLLNTLISESHLFYQIGSDGDQSVYTRTFSALQIALIVRRHRLNPFLNRTEFVQLKDSLIRYCKEEKDLRGYVAVEGWAHSAAHIADVLAELVQCHESDATVQLEVLTAIQGILQNGKQTLGEEEDERIASIVDVILEKELLPSQTIADWIDGLVQCGSWPKSRAQAIARVNGKNMLRSLYFRRERQGRAQDLSAVIQAAEAALNRFAIR